MPRIQRILYKLSQREAPHLTPPGWDQGEDRVVRVRVLARRLADYGTLALMGELAPDLHTMEDLHVQDWVHGFARLYHLLAQALFPPALTKVEAVYADDNQPTVVIFRAPAAPILACFAAYVVPYVSLRQPEVVESELRDLINLLLDELEAGDLPTHVLDELRISGIDTLIQILHASVRHISLTDLDPKVKALLRPAPLPPVRAQNAPQSTPPMPQPIAPPFVPQSAPPPPPQSTPPMGQPAVSPSAPMPPTGFPEERFELDFIEEEPESPPTPTEEMFRVRLPIPKPGGTSKRQPPVPRLPDRKDED